MSSSGKAVNMTSSPSFTQETTSEEVAAAFADQIKGKTILITGVSPGGLAEAMCNALAPAAPSCLILTSRDVSKADIITSQLHKQFPNIAIHTLPLDLSFLTSVRTAATSLATLISNIDIMLNNAGVMGIPTRQLSPEGVEMHLATNYLGHFLLTNLLRPLLSPTSRVINITSGGYILTPFRFSDPNFTSNNNLPPSERANAEMAKVMGLPDLHAEGGEAYVPLLAYCHSNTASMLFTTHLAKNGIMAYSAAPGVVETRLQRHMPEGFRNPVMVYKSPTQGAATFLVAAFDLKLEDVPGAYLDDCKIVEPATHASDEQAAKRLWKMSEELVGEEFGL